MVATETISVMMNDLDVLEPCATPSTEDLQALLQSRNVRTVDFSEWEKIDAEELRRGRLHEQSRTKFLTTEDMMAFLDQLT